MKEEWILEEKRESPPQLLHPASAMILIAIDALWSVFEIAPLFWVLTIPI